MEVFHFCSNVLVSKQFGLYQPEFFSDYDDRLSFCLDICQYEFVFCICCAQVCSPLLIPISREKEVGIISLFHCELDIFLLAVDVLKKKM